MYGSVKIQNRKVEHENRLKFGRLKSPFTAQTAQSDPFSSVCFIPLSPCSSDRREMESLLISLWSDRYTQGWGNQQGYPPIDTSHIQREWQSAQPHLFTQVISINMKSFEPWKRGAGKEWIIKMGELQQQKSACSISHCLGT